MIIESLLFKILNLYYTYLELSWIISKTDFINRKSPHLLTLSVKMVPAYQFVTFQ